MLDLGCAESSQRPEREREAVPSLSERIAQLYPRAAPLIYRRALALLGELDRQADHPAVRPAFLAFRAAFLAQNGWY